MRLTLDNIPPEIEYPSYDKHIYERDLYEVIKNNPIPEEDIKNNTMFSVRSVPKCYNHVFLNIESDQSAKIPYSVNGNQKFKTCNRSNIIRCCILLGHSVFQHNEFIKNFIEEFEDNARYSKSADESELFSPNNTKNIIDSGIVQLGDSKKIYCTMNVLMWADSKRSLFNMSRNDLLFLLFCIGALRVPYRQNVYQEWAIQNMEEIVKECSLHILKRRLDVEYFYKAQKLKDENIFENDIII